MAPQFTAAKAVGGVERWEKDRSRTFTMDIEVKGTNSSTGEVNGSKGRIEVCKAVPNRLASSMMLANIGEFQQGFNGTIGWSKDPVGGLRLPHGGTSRVLPGPSGEILVTTTFENYRDFDGLKFAGKVTQKVMETEQVTTLLKVDRNGVADSKFVLPEGITGLLAARGRGTATR